MTVTHSYSNISRAFSLALCCTLLASAGCKKQVSGGAAPSSDTHAVNAHIDPANAGTINGTVHVTGKVPERIEIDMAQDPACAMSPEGKNLTEQIVADKGKLANVYVYVEDGLGNRIYPAPTEPAVLDQKGCRYVPHVLAAMVGQPIEFRNSDPTMHNVHMQPTIGGNQAFDVSQPPNAGTIQHAFSKPEMLIPVRCNNHPWMEAFLNIAPNPFFAVSGPDGHFTIQGLPPGKYTLVAVQEKLGTQHATVTVGPHAAATTDFTFAVK